MIGMFSELLWPFGHKMKLYYGNININIKLWFLRLVLTWWYSRKTIFVSLLLSIRRF